MILSSRMWFEAEPAKVHSETRSTQPHITNGRKVAGMAHLTSQRYRPCLRMSYSCENSRRMNASCPDLSLPICCRHLPASPRAPWARHTRELAIHPCHRKALERLLSETETLPLKWAWQSSTEKEGWICTISAPGHTNYDTRPQHQGKLNCCSALRKAR